MDPATIIRVRVLQLVTVLAAVVSWEVVARAGWVDPLFVPAPSAVARALLRIGGTAFAGLGDTLGKTAVAYVLSVTASRPASSSARYGCCGTCCPPT